MAFFSGWPDGTPGHDDLAERIGMNGVRFVRDHWRWEDAQAYVSLTPSVMALILIYAYRCSDYSWSMHVWLVLTEMRRPITVDCASEIYLGWLLVATLLIRSFECRDYVCILKDL